MLRPIRTPGNRSMLTLAMLVVLPGCSVMVPTGFHPNFNFTGVQQPTAEQAQEGLRVSVEEFVSADKSRRAFDADIASYGVLALAVGIENRGTGKYQLHKDDIKAFLGEQPLPTLSATEAADQSTRREFSAKTLANDTMAVIISTLFFPAFGAAALSSIGSDPLILSPGNCHLYLLRYTCTVREIRQHFQGLEFNDKVVKPNETGSGFVYFKLPDKIKTLENLIVYVEPSEEQSGSQLTFKLFLPTLEIAAADSR